MRLRIHMVEQGMGVDVYGSKAAAEHPRVAEFRIMDDVSFGRIDKQVGLYYRVGGNPSDGAGDLSPFASASGTCRVSDATQENGADMAISLRGSNLEKLGEQTSTC